MISIRRVAYMKLHITQEAANWYVNELELDTPTQIRLFPRYGGVGGIIPGYSVGINNDLPEVVHASSIVSGIKFFIEEKDAWYFDGYHLTIQFDEELNEPEFIYESQRR